MGCGCSGGGSKQAQAVKTMMASTRPSQPGVEWKVTFPNQSTQTFPTEWQAQHAVKLAGGKATRVTKGPDKKGDKSSARTVRAKRGKGGSG